VAYTTKTRDEHFLPDGKPKRILALDGGGLRGILTLGILAKIEALLKDRHGGGEQFRLCDYFDLIAGTSTGAIIAAALALGLTIEEISKIYLNLGERVFKKSTFRKGVFRALYGQNTLIKELQNVYGEKTTLGGSELKTGVLIVTKRLDSGSPWPLGNNPQGIYFGPGTDPQVIPNKDYPLWKVVRASTAAPRYFEPETMEIIRAPGKKRVAGQFVDGGVSPFNNPALQALLYVTLDGYRVGWPLGVDKLLLVSVGTGSRDPKVTPTSITASHAVKSLVALMDDCAALVETLLQWMSKSPTARSIDSEIGDLRNDLIAQAPLLSYLRYNIELEPNTLDDLGLNLSAAEVAPLSEMDDPANMARLKQIGELVGEKKVHGEHFPAAFDITA